ncbi:MAG TPA: nucleoside-triphosphatase [Candidatus Bilamarchaeaceae archaeon]|nr:nucleoside-triphosphatase [Candidatus Bilamarchaeaceae archaeon]
MITNWFITGKPLAGKTTLIKMIVEKLKKYGVKVGGFITPEEKHHGVRTGFFVQDIETGVRVKFADTEYFAPKVGKYGVKTRLFESVVLPIFERLDDYDIVVIDQIGTIELRSTRFGDKLQELLESRKPVICTLEEQLLPKYKVFGEVREVNYENKTQLEEEIYQKIVVNVSVEKMSRTVREKKEGNLKEKIVHTALKAVKKIEKEEKTSKTKKTTSRKKTRVKPKQIKKKNVKKKIVKRKNKK